MLEDETQAAEQEIEKIKTAKANKKKAQQGSMADLEKMILAKRENGFGGFMNYMTSKYGCGDDDDEVIEMGPSKKNLKSKKRPLNDSNEEENNFKKNKKGGMRRKMN